MNKKLTMTDYLLSLLLLAVLIGALGAFFLGVKIGQERTAEKYEKLLIELQANAHELAAYHQEYLASFYHTIYLPYRDFQKKWFDHMEAIELQSEPLDARNAFEELSKLAAQKFAAIEHMAMPESSPLLVDAHHAYMKSLKLFEDVAKDYKGKARNMKDSELVAAVESDPHFIEARQFALAGQQYYYEAMLEWLKANEPDLRNSELAGADDLTFQEWARLNLIQKNVFVAGAMADGGYYAFFTPQDLALRVDEMIAGGQADKLAYTSIRPLIDTLVETKAVRDGDYLKGRQKYYAADPVPQLPFFFD